MTELGAGCSRRLTTSLSSAMIQLDGSCGVMRYVNPPRHQPILSDQAGCQNLSENRDESTFCRGREQIASTSLDYPSYLSFESALARHGILSQIPHTFTFATTRPSKTASV